MEEEHEDVWRRKRDRMLKGTVKKRKVQSLGFLCLVFEGIV